MGKYVLSKMVKQKEAAFFVVMIVLSFIAASATPYLNGKFVDLLTVSKDVSLIVQFAFIIIGIGVLGAVLSYFANLTTVKVVTKTTMTLIFDGMENFLKTDLIIAEKFKSSYITQRLFQDTNVITTFVLSNFLSIFLNGVLIVGVLLCFFMINPLLCIVVIIVIVPYIVLFRTLKVPLLKSSEQKKEADTLFFGNIHSIIEQILDIQLNSRFSEAKREGEESFANCFPFIVKAGRLSYLFSSIDSIIQIVFQSILFVFAGIQITIGKMTIGEFIMINSYFSLLLRAVKYYTSIYKQYQDALASYKRINTILTYPKMQNGMSKIDEINIIEVKDLNYSFPEQKKMIFSNANCIFHKGESYEIIGENGEGKSTLFKIITVLYGHGLSVAFNNQFASNVDLENARINLLSCVPQKIFAPKVKVRDFLLRKLNITSQELNSMIENDRELREYSQYIRNIWEHQCDTLSGGELRKLHIWAAIKKEADVLLLDEPTTDLDIQSQTELTDFIKENKHKQLIIVMTHDKNIVDLAQHVIKIKEGGLFVL